MTMKDSSARRSDTRATRRASSARATRKGSNYFLFVTRQNPYRYSRNDAINGIMPIFIRFI